MTKEIKLTKGLVALVDEGDFELLKKFSWHSSGVRGNEYAARRARDSENRNRAMVLMHRQILGVAFCDKHWHVDHINGNRLDNRRKNLRLVTRAQNLQNSTTANRQTGISYDSTHNKFKAYVNIPQTYGTKRINVGTFKTRVEAIKARDKFLREMA